MAEPDFLIKTGDTGSKIVVPLEDSTGAAIDIQGATGIFKMGAIAGGTLALAGTVTILQVGAGTSAGGSMGYVSYQWPTGGVATSGLYLAEFEMTYSSGTIQTFPNGGFMTVLVTDDL